MANITLTLTEEQFKLINSAVSAYYEKLEEIYDTVGIEEKDMEEWQKDSDGAQEMMKLLLGVWMGREACKCYQFSDKEQEQMIHVWNFDRTTEVVL